MTIVHWRHIIMLKICLLIFSETSTGSACHIPSYVNTVPTVHDYTKRDLDRCVTGEPRWTFSVKPLAYTHICIREGNSVIMGYYQYFAAWQVACLQTVVVAGVYFNTDPCLMVTDVLCIGPHLQIAVQFGTKLITFLYTGMLNLFSTSRYILALLKIHIVELLVMKICDVVSGEILSQCFVYMTTVVTSVM